MVPAEESWIIRWMAVIFTECWYLNRRKGWENKGLLLSGDHQFLLENDLFLKCVTVPRVPGELWVSVVLKAHIAGENHLFQTGTVQLRSTIFWFWKIFFTWWSSLQIPWHKFASLEWEMDLPVFSCFQGA